MTRLMLLSVVLCALISRAYGVENCSDWDYWESFAQNHIQKDGRVIDFGADGITTSEGQSYALFFALVANDQSRFDHILKWTQDNLAGGDFQSNLPGWKWGKSSDGRWMILDSNSASDADLWIAYSVFLAEDWWGGGGYLPIANGLLRNIVKQEVVDLPKLGQMLLPGAIGFSTGNDTWRLNPSYMPIQLLRYFAKRDSNGPWAEIAENTVRMIIQSSVRGVVPDWVTYKTKLGFVDDSQMGHVSSFDAIRVYLWWAMLNQKDPMFWKLKAVLKEVEQFDVNNKFLPERIRARVGEEEGVAPSGYFGALAPYKFILYGQHEKVNWPPSDLDLGYYNMVLNLFGLGWLEHRFSFDADGSLTVRSHQECLK